MSPGPPDLRRPRALTAAHAVVNAGVVTAAAMIPLMALMIVVHPFGTMCGNGTPDLPCTMDIKTHQQLALDVRGLLIVDAAVLAGIVAWALRRAERSEHLGIAIAAASGLVTLSASVPMALSSLGSSHLRETNEWWAIVWLGSPLVLLAVRRVSGRIRPALLALAPAALVLIGGLLLI